MSQSMARMILVRLIRTHESFYMAAGKVYTLDQVLTILKGRKVAVDEAQELLNSLSCSTK